MIPAPHDHAVDLETALDFVNTLELERGEPVDHLGTTQAALDWLREHGLIHRTAARPGRSGDAALRRIRLTRAALRELADATYEHRAPQPGAIDEVNRALRGREVVQLVPGPDGLRLDHRHVGDPVDDALANLATPIVQELRRAGRNGLGPAPATRCRWVFYDDSRTGRRRWCDMASCGNRAKARRHRARARADAAG